MILCIRTVRVPAVARDRFLHWIDENRELRQEHGILFELVLERSPRQNPAKTLQPADLVPAATGEEDAIVLTAWVSHDAFDAWIDTPHRDRLTASDVHASVQFGPITRYDVEGGYVNLRGLSSVDVSWKEERI